MDLLLVKKLISLEILDFPKLLMLYYKEILLSEKEAFLMLELCRQLKEGDDFLSPTKLSSKMTLQKEELFTMLDGLLKRNYISIQLVKRNGKESEVFNLDETLKKLLAIVDKEIKSEYLDQNQTDLSPIEEIANLIETQFQKQLLPLDVEMIDKWVNQDHYDLFDIKKALLDSLKASRFSMSYVDTILLKRKNQTAKKEEPKKVQKSKALKSFLDSVNDKS